MIIWLRNLKIAGHNFEVKTILQKVQDFWMNGRVDTKTYFLNSTVFFMSSEILMILSQNSKHQLVFEPTHRAMSISKVDVLYLSNGQ